MGRNQAAITIHTPWFFWLAGGGVKGGVSFGATDEIGHKAVENRVTVNDLHATFLRLMGLDHKRLTFRHNGRDFRLTDVAGKCDQGGFSVRVGLRPRDQPSRTVPVVKLLFASPLCEPLHFVEA